MQQNVARRPRFTRVANPPTIRLTDRDKEIISAVTRFRFLTTSEILLLIRGSRQNIVRRLQRLYHIGFLDRPKSQLPLRFAGELSEIVYSQAKRTVSGRKRGSVSSLFLAHALSVSDALIHIEKSCQLRGLEFVPDQTILNAAPCLNARNRMQWRVSLKCGNAKEKIGVIPDAIFGIERRDHSSKFRRFFFLESDRGTMPLDRKDLRLSSIRRKALAYSNTRRNRILREKFGIPGFQVLFVTRSRARLERMKEVCKAVSGRNLSIFLYATQDDLKRHDALAILGVI